MASLHASDSLSTRVQLHCDADRGEEFQHLPTRRIASSSTGPLVTSKLENIQPVQQSMDHSNPSQASSDSKPTVDKASQSTMDGILAKLGAKNTGSLSRSSEDILADLTKHAAVLTEQHKKLVETSDNKTRVNYHAAVNSEGLASPVYHNETTACTDFSKPQDEDELIRLREELNAAKSRIAHQDQELAQARVIRQTMDHAAGSNSEIEFGARGDLAEQSFGHMQNVFKAPNRQYDIQFGAFQGHEERSSEISEKLSPTGIDRTRNWTNSRSVQNGLFGAAGVTRPVDAAHSQRVFSNPSAAASFPVYPIEQRLTEIQQPLSIPGLRRSSSGLGRGGRILGQPNQIWSSYDGSVTQTGRAQPFGGFQAMPLLPSIGQYQQRPIGTPLLPHTGDFTGNQGIPTQDLATPWGSNMSVSTGQGNTYVSPLEPLNYRRLLDKTVSCDWKYIVDKIVCSNDQQASIFLQQKLKIGTVEHKFEIIEAIIGQAFPLMVNRFGNFLIQRCFEHGTAEQVESIANSVRGNTVALSMDPFGCHVVQKAFDTVPEDYKAMMVHELLRQIPQTVVHRYACHVWQKLFELRWSNEPPQIMTKVNEALCGMWHEVALGETGSLVVQNIFENCVEDEKRMAIEEVIASIDLLARGQFGNWCIQHICEHGAPQDRSRAIEHIVVNATDYSMDQFASKVVEKCLKIGGPEFMQRYLDRVTSGRADRPRMPLIDVAGDQYGNYLIQWVLLNTTNPQREIVASHIRKHMVSLRGSKFGSRVAMLCTNPNIATRPGPGAGIQVNRYGTANEDRLLLNPAPVGKFARNHLQGNNYR